MKNNLNDDSNISLLAEILEQRYLFAQHVDTQTNILIGLSTAIFLFSASLFLGNHPDLPFLSLSVFSGLSALVGLFGIHPPKFLRKCGQLESLIYSKKIASFSSSSEYGKELKKIIADNDLAFQELATEIYNVSKYYYRPKRKLFHIARNILIAGIFINTLIFALTLGLSLAMK